MSVLYVDTSALMKRAVSEVGSAEVQAAMATRSASGDLVVASSLAWLELWRGLRRLGQVDVARGVDDACAGVEEFPLDDAVLHQARAVGGLGLRSLDAVHLASAEMVGADAIMTFDGRLSAASRSIGIDVLSPHS